MMDLGTYRPCQAEQDDDPGSVDEFGDEDDDDDAGREVHYPEGTKKPAMSVRKRGATAFKVAGGHSLQ